MARLRQSGMEMTLCQNPAPRICVHGDASGAPSAPFPSQPHHSCVCQMLHDLDCIVLEGRSELHTISIKSFAMLITISTVEFEGTRIVVLAFHPSEDFPLRIGVLGSEYEYRSTTHVTMSV